MSHEKKAKSEPEVALGAFRFNPETRELIDADNQIVHMRNQSAHVLAVLVDADGAVVEKDTLFEQVWRGVATTDDSLVQCVSDIRRTLGQEAVETFPKRGYRLAQIASVSPPTPRARRHFAPIIALFAVCIVALAASFTYLAPSSPDAIRPPEVSPEDTLAVLPFVNLNPDNDLTFLSDGLSEDIATDLSKVPSLTVIAPASSFDFRNAEAGFQRIADDLGVRYLVRGTVRQEGDRVRINVSLIDPEEGANLWSDRFDRQMESVFGLQDEVTRHVVDALSLTLDRQDSPAERIEPDAYFMLLRGLEVLREAGPDALQEARVLFENAVVLDPQYARAYASLALISGREAARALPDGEAVQTLVESGLERAVTAIQFDPKSPHAYLALGTLNLAIREYDNALAAARHAIRQDANFADGYALLAEVGLFGAGLDEALRAIRRAKLLHPHHTSEYNHIEGAILFQMGRYEAAAPLLKGSETVTCLATLFAAYGFLDNAEGASGLLRRSGLNNEALQRAAKAAPFRFDERRDRLIEGIVKAASIE